MMFGMDVGGFLTSREFFTQLAAFFSAILSAVFGGLINGFFGVTF